MILFVGIFGVSPAFGSVTFLIACSPDYLRIHAILVDYGFHTLAGIRFYVSKPYYSSVLLVCFKIRTVPQRGQIIHDPYFTNPNIGRREDMILY